MTTPSQSRVRAVINMLFADTEGERQSAMTQLYKMKAQLPHNTILSDYISGAMKQTRCPADDLKLTQQQLRITELNGEIIRLKTEVTKYQIAHRSAEFRAQEAQEARTAMRSKLAETEENLRQLRREMRGRQPDERCPWTRDEVEFLLGSYRDVCAKHAGLDKRRRKDAFDHMCAVFNCGDWFRTPKAIKVKLRELREADPSIPHLFPEHAQPAT